MKRARANKKGFVNNAIGIRHRNLSIRIEVLEHYGGLQCACCGEPEFSFLSLDHVVDGAGCSHRSELFGSKFTAGHHMYRKLRSLGFPEGFQVLCMNCQIGRRDNGGVCPHKRKPLTGPELLREFDKLRVGKGNREATDREDYRSALANVMRRVDRVSANKTVAEGGILCPTDGE